MATVSVSYSFGHCKQFKCNPEHNYRYTKSSYENGCCFHVIIRLQRRIVTLFQLNYLS